MFNKLKKLKNKFFGPKAQQPAPEPAGTEAATPQEDEALAEVEEAQGEAVTEAAGIDVAEQSQAVEEAAGEVEEQNKAPRSANALQELGSQLESSKTSMHASLKGIFGKKNSDAYSNVISAIKTCIRCTEGGFSKDIKENKNKIKSASFATDMLLTACKMYIAKNESPNTAVGKNRKKKIEQILEIAQLDQAGLRDIFIAFNNMPASEQEGITWNKVLTDIRTTPIEVEDLMSKKRFGSQMKTGEQASRGLDSGMFTPETKGKRGGTALEEANLDSFHNVVNFHTNLPGDHEAGEERNISGRNVATSRVANMLGLGGLVAQSKTVFVHDQKTGKKIRGNLMEWAKGSEAKGVINEKKNDVANEGGDDIKKREESARQQMEPGVMKDLTNLQVLDYLCGQKDRHDGNFFLQTDKETGKITGVKAIDNDMSFGMETDYRSTWLNAQDKQGVRKSTEVVDSDNNLVMPVFDKDVADAVLDMKPDELRFALEDLIEKDALEAAVVRLVKLQKALKKVKSDSPERLTTTWDKTTHEKIMSESMIHKAALNEKDGTDESLFKLEGNARYSYKNLGAENDWNKSNTLYSRTMYRMMGVNGNHVDFDNFCFDKKSAINAAYKAQKEKEAEEKRKQEQQQK